jgi:hypothetical protein
MLAATLPLASSAASAQGSGQGFLFEKPGLQVGVRAGYAVARAGGGVLDRAMENFTLNKRDFDSSSWGIELAVRARERLDIAFDLRFSRSKTGSESRPYVDLDNLPITQTTTFSRVPVTLGAKFYLRDRGRAVSEFAWIPEKWAPFIGVGAGVNWYKIEQEGDFVDESTPNLDILFLTIKSSGLGPTAHAFAGMDISMSPRFLWTVEARYGFGGAETNSAFAFETIDLSGFQATIGVSARF